MTLPSYARDFRGHPACPCQIAWIPVYEAELQRRGILTGPIHIYQLIGGAPQSGGTHVDGGASDFLDLPGDVDVEVARQMGADATWSRPYDWDGHDGIAHIHSVLTGCPHNGPARYQITDVRDGLNGLANHGRDTGPRPLSGRTWQQGIQWALQQEDDMPYTEEQLAAIIGKAIKDATPAIAEAVIDSPVGKDGATLGQVVNQTRNAVKS